MSSFVGSSELLLLLYISISLVLIFTTNGVRSGIACLSNPCVHGVCLDNANSTYFCYCIDGYTGIQCQTNWNECWSFPCQNGGICIDGIASFNCSCPPGFLGDLCEIDFNECESNPCWNNGTCLDDTNGYFCSCLPGYSGTHCEIDVAVCNTTNETRCANGGICQEGPGVSFTCLCQPGWQGPLCYEEIDECLSTPCQNGAVCVDTLADYYCACLFGFTGKNCEETVQICDTNPCANGAICLLEDGRPVCYCVPDFHGELCQFQYDECQIGPSCLNGGTCIDGIANSTCSCPPLLTGVRCECLILENNSTLDCTYVSPKPSSTTTTSTEVPTTTTELTITKTKTTITTDLSTLPMSTTTEEVSGTTAAITDVTVTEESPLSSESSTEYSTSSTASALPSAFDNVTTRTTDDKVFSTIFSTTFTPFSTTERITESGYSSFGSTSFQISSETEPPLTTTELEKTLSALTTEAPSLSTETSEVWTETTHTSTWGGSSEATLETSPSISGKTVTSSSSSTSSEVPMTTDFPTTKMPEPNLTLHTLTTEETTSYPSSITTFLTKEPDVTSGQSEPYTISDITASDNATSTSKIPVPFDCTDHNSSCLNGGTCTYTKESGYQCICPFDTEGQRCELIMGIKTAAFTGNSYLTHRLGTTTNISVEFEAKTLSKDGLWFYCTIDGAYMALYMENGHLKFKFSCGYQTMLLTELNVPVNNGFWIKVKAILEFSRDLKHCDASIKINESLSMAGDQISVINKLVKYTPLLHLGGIPQRSFDQNLPFKGYIGCMTNLKILGKRVSIFKDAEDGMRITECSSLACLSNPCQNGATCLSSGEEWSCNCKNGFLGTKCEISVCEDNPCLFGGTCLPFSGSGYICLCPFGKHGHLCENDIKIIKPNFSSAVRGLSSYIAYPIPEGISENLELRFRFIPTMMDQISLLMFIGQKGHHDFYSDHIAVSFVKGYIMLTWNLGAGPRRIFTTRPIPEGFRDYSIRLGRFGRRAWLFVDKLENVTGKSPGNLFQLDVLPVLYLGGHESRNFSTLPHDLPLHTGFSGCIFDVQLISGSIIIPLLGSKQTTGRAVGQCGTSECYEQSCQNRGACLHHGSTFTCLCQDSWFDPLCSSKRNPCDSTNHRCSSGSTCVPVMSNYECDCPVGKSGQYCEKDEDITDVGFTGIRSFLSLIPIEFEEKQFNIEMEIRILNDNGLLLFVGRPGVGFVCLSVQNGFLELRIFPGESSTDAVEPTTLSSTKLLIKGVWYKIHLGIFGKKVFLAVGTTVDSRILSSDRITKFSNENIYLGGLPDLSTLPPLATSKLPVSYKGCIRHVFCNSKQIVLSKPNILDGRNLNDCDGTPCGKDACLNGGTCWLDSFLKPHCACVPPFYGQKCEILPECSEKNCQNEGKCDDHTCYCKVGWNGAFCENRITVKVPEFTRNSYLVLEKVGDKKRNVRQTDLKHLYLNFTTVRMDGLLVWKQKKDSFLGIGIEKGFLKIAYGSKSHKNSMVFSSYSPISDGLWHNIHVTFSPLRLKLDEHNVSPYNEKYTQKNGESAISLVGPMYIGGIPREMSMSKETSGIFSKHFEGCIEAFAVNNEKTIKDFTDFDGNNIAVCKVL